jgi:hypothetical protein
VGAGSNPDRESHRAEAEAALERARRLLEAPGPLDEKTRGEVLAALGELKGALEPALERRPDAARSVSTFAEAVAHEATRPAPSRSVLGIALEGLNETAERLELTYPRLSAIVERFADALGRIGI